MRDPVYDVVGAFARRLVELGVEHVVVSPGSRSTALALCFDAQPGLKTWIQHDERCAGFFALGVARATGQPAVMVCSSGTAAANYLPAVVEASHAGVPMIVCTADRPPELRDGWGAPQTIDQINLYGTAVRYHADLDLPQDVDAATAVGWANTAVSAALGPDPGPAHLNWPLREPLAPIDWPNSPDTPTESLRGSEISSPVPGVTVDEVQSGLDRLLQLAQRHERGVVVAGPWPGGGLQREQQWAADVVEFAAWAGWPAIGEPITQLRSLGGGAGMWSSGAVPNSSTSRSQSRVVEGDAVSQVGVGVVVTADHLLADRNLADRLAPDVAVLAGRTITTKPVRLWLERTRPRHVILIDPENRWDSAVFHLTDHVPANVETLRTRIDDMDSPRPFDSDRSWLHGWHALDKAARITINALIEPASDFQQPQQFDAQSAASMSKRMLSAQATRAVVGSLPPGSVLVASNSMPVRDLDAYVFEADDLLSCANRGAAGIDGTTSTALGVAAAHPDRNAVLYSGDLALLHDLGGLVAAARLGLHLVIVCIDNNGGEIFSLLPIVKRISSSDHERLFNTPHNIDLNALNGFAGIRASRPLNPSELASAIREACKLRQPGVDLLIVDVDRDADIAQRRSLTATAQQAARDVATQIKWLN